MLLIGGYVLLSLGLLATLVMFVYEHRSSRTSSEALARLSASRIASLINNVDVQQFFANSVTALRFLAQAGGSELPTPRHAHSRAVLLEDRPDLVRELRPTDFAGAVEACRRATRMKFGPLWGQLDAQLVAFVDTKRAFQHGGKTLQGRNVEGVIHDVMREYPDLIGEGLCKRETLLQVFDAEGVAVQFMDDVEGYCVLVSHGGKLAVLVRRDIHTAVQDFLLAHELGHWFLHIRNNLAADALGVNYYLHSYHEWDLLEGDADRFAMNVVFPTPFIANLEWRNDRCVDPSVLLESLRQNYSSALPVPFVGRLESYCLERMREYRAYKAQLFDLRFPDRPIQEGVLLEDVLKWLGDDYAWGLLGTDNRVRRCSKSYAEQVFGSSEAALVGRDVVLDLTEPSHAEKTTEQLNRKRRTAKPTFYFTRFVRQDSGKAFPAAVYAFPIQSGDEYAGALGIIRPLH